MSNLKFIDPGMCEIDGEEMILFKDPITLFKEIQKALHSIGAKRFFSDPNSGTQRMREGLPAYFFLLALRKSTNRDWFLMNPRDSFPDCYLMSIGQSPAIDLQGLEQTEIPPECPSFDEALKIINKKMTKGYPLNHSSLLVFINNINSKDWVNMINKNLNEFKPFKSVWTVHLLANNENSDLIGAVINQIRPLPVKHIPIKFDDVELYLRKPIPQFIEVIEQDEHTFLKPKQDFVIEFKKVAKRFILSNNQKAPSC